MVLCDGDHDFLSIKLRDCQLFFGTQFVPTALRWYPLWLFTWSFGYSSIASDGSPYEKRVDAKGRVLSEECIAGEVPFEGLPEGWAWARLSTVLQLSSGLGYKKDNLSVKGEHMVRILRGGNIGEGDEPLIKENDVMISMEFVDASLFLRDGQIITPAVTSLENVGKAAIVRSMDGNTVCGGFVFFLTPFLIDPCHSEYLHRYLTSPTHVAFCKSAVKKSGQAFYNLSKSSLNSALIAIPPLAEQRRIVERVGQLMPLVEEYGDLEDAREELDSTLPSRLRKSVLQMAVQGKLVPQDPADEPASALLERIRGQRRKLIAEKKMKAPKGGESIIFRGSDGRRYEKRVDAKGRESEPTCIEDEIPFETPDSWEWARLSSVLQLNSGLGYKKDNLAVKGEKMIRVLRGGNIGEEDEPLIKNNDVMISAEFVDDNLLPRDGQILTPSVTSLENVGKTAIIRNTDGNTVCGGFVFFLTPFLIDPCHSEYLHRYLASPDHISFCKSSVKKSGQAFYNLSKASLNSALIAIPPLAEQHRIVERVAEFMPLVTNQ